MVKSNPYQLSLARIGCLLDVSVGEKHKFIIQMECPMPKSQFPWQKADPPLAGNEFLMTRFPKLSALQ